MNYWPAEATNLAELHEPFIDFIERVAVNGHRTAQVNYNARGWVAHHNSDIWAQSAPVGEYGKGDPVWANWHGGSAWLSQHLWEHYAFGGDVQYLRERAYPVMKAACEFYLDFLVPNEKGYLVTSPSASPELRFKLPDGRHRGAERGRDDGSRARVGSVHQHHRGVHRARRRRGVPRADPAGEARS